MHARVAQWEASQEIGAKTAERYRELVENQIVPHLGLIAVQKLRPLDMEQWYIALRSNGRKDGRGGVSTRTIRHAHRILSKALREAVRHDLAIRNVAAVETAPKVDTREMLTPTDEQVRDRVAKLRGRTMHAPATTALFTGLRRGELLALRWRNVDLDKEKVIRVREALEQTKAAGLRFKAPKTKAGDGT
jgi:integrase